MVPGEWVDTPTPDGLHSVARRTAKGGFERLLSSLAVQCGLERAQPGVALGDGAPWMGNLVSDQVPQAVQMVDLSHAKEHVWDVAHAVFGGGTSEATAWATQACGLLVEGEMEALLAAIGALPPIPPEPGQARRTSERAIDYFSTNAQRMRYPHFRAEAHASGQRPRRGRLQNGGRHPR